jgi:hypothetical protein
MRVMSPTIHQDPAAKRTKIAKRGAPWRRLLVFSSVYAGDPPVSVDGGADVTKHGDDLAGDLYKLEEAGAVVLPAVADAIRDAATPLATAVRDEDDVFDRPFLFGGDTTGPVGQAWTELCDELISVLGRTAEVVDECGYALRLAAAEYARVDSAAAASLADLLAQAPLAGPDREHPVG